VHASAFKQRALASPSTQRAAKALLG